MWSKAFIGEDDRVVPPTNQENYWRIQGVPFTHLPKTPHYLLGHFRRWEEFW
nr:pimeloyl-ACP methyl esterase BioG family protein [Porphyromonas sp.]